MISFVKGKLVYIYENTIIVENNGIGYEIFVPMSVIGNDAADWHVKFHDIYIYECEGRCTSVVWIS